MRRMLRDFLKRSDSGRRRYDMHINIKAAALVLIAGISGGCGRTVGQTSESAADSNAVTEATTVMQTTNPPTTEPVTEPPLSEAEKLLQDLTLHEKV